MSVRQYIGARYVTKIYENSLDPSSAEWEQGTFEPLVMVTWQNSTYLSKKQVPGSVGNPADNPNYWVCTGYYNGQIMQLQNDIQDINDFIDSLIVTPEMFGAVGDGVTDDSQAFQDALDSIAAGGTLLLAPKTYLINTTLVVKGEFKLMGFSYVASKIHFTGTGAVLDPNTACEMTITDVSFYSDASVSSCYKAGTIGFNTTGNCTLERVSFEAFEYASVWGGGYYHHFADVWVTECRVGFWNYDQNNLTFTKCRFRKLEYAIYCNAGGGPLTITGCSFEDICKFGISGVNTGLQAVISGCYFENSNSTIKPGFTSDDGTYATGSPIYSQGTMKLTVTLTGNTFTGYFFRIVYREVGSPDPGIMIIANGNYFSINQASPFNYVYGLPSTGQCIANDVFDSFTLTLNDYIRGYDASTCRIFDPTTNAFNY